MPKFCTQCGRQKHEGVCDMATLSDGRIVRASRIDIGGDLHDSLGADLKVINRWIRKPPAKKTTARRS